MAVACKECGNAVDENAPTCPHCGTPWPGRRAAASHASAAPARQGGGVVITGVDIPFGDLVVLIIKVMFASIPAYLILFVIFSIIGVVFGGLFAAMLGGLTH